MGIAEAQEQSGGNARFELPAVVIPLLKGVFYRDADAASWSALLNLQSRVRD